MINCELNAQTTYIYTEKRKKKLHYMRRQNIAIVQGDLYSDLN